MKTPVLGLHQIVVHGHGGHGKFEVLWTPSEWVKVHAIQKLVITLCRPVEPTQLLPHPGQ